MRKEIAFGGKEHYNRDGLIRYRVVRNVGHDGYIPICFIHLKSVTAQ